jgi:DNA repair exonuclease SbcCD ATPase subunit
MSFLNKLKSSLDGALNKLKAMNNAINQVIKENNQFLHAELALGKEAGEGINALKTYAQSEGLSLGEAFQNIAGAMEAIETSRKEKVDALKNKFIGPLNEILEKYKILTSEIQESEKAKKALESAQKDLEKKKSAASQGKGKPGDVENAEAKLKAAEEKYQKEESEAKAETVKFNTEKIQKFQQALNSLIEEQKKFYQAAIEKLDGALDSVKKIDIHDAEKITEEAE